MKKERNRGLRHTLQATIAGMLTIALCMTLLMSVSFAQRHSSHSGWHQGMASVAEQEIRSEEQTAVAESEKNIVSHLKSADDGRLTESHETDATDSNSQHERE